MEGLPMKLQLPFLVFDQVRKDLDCELFYSELKHPQRLTLYLLSNTDNIHIVLENDNTVLIKRT